MVHLQPQMLKFSLLMAHLLPCQQIVLASNPGLIRRRWTGVTRFRSIDWPKWTEAAINHSEKLAPLVSTQARPGVFFPQALSGSILLAIFRVSARQCFLWR